MISNDPTVVWCDGNTCLAQEADLLLLLPSASLLGKKRMNFKYTDGIYEPEFTSVWAEKFLKQGIPRKDITVLVAGTKKNLNHRIP